MNLPFKNLYIPRTEPWEELIDVRDNTVPTLHYKERLDIRSKMTIEEARVAITDGISKGLVGTVKGGYLIRNKGLHVVNRVGKKIIMVTYLNNYEYKQAIKGLSDIQMLSQNDLLRLKV